MSDNIVKLGKREIGMLNVTKVWGLKYDLILIFFFLCFNATFINIPAISWRLILVVEEARVPEENHRSWASNW